MTLYFPDVAQEDFDFEADWLVKSIDPKGKKILFEGQGKNSDLELLQSYQDNPKAFNEFAIGDLVQLPKEVFIEPVDKPYRPIYEHF